MARPTQPSNIEIIVATDTAKAGEGQLLRQAPMADDVHRTSSLPAGGEMASPLPPNNENPEELDGDQMIVEEGQQPQPDPMPDDAGHSAVPINEPRCFLYKVPEQICRTDEKMHMPSYISIGPYKYQENVLPNRSQLWKEECKRQVVQKLPEQDRSKALGQMATSIETDVKNYYDTRSFAFDEKAFREMMITDGCFLLVTTLHDNPAAVQRTFIPNQWDNLFRWHDILLYGNQLPFHVVREIYKLIHPNEDPRQKVGKDFADSALIRYTRRTVTTPGNADNVLHLCHILLKPTDRNRSGNGVVDVKTGRWRRATEYRKLLVEFKKREIGSEGEAQCISDVRVVGGNVVEIPSFEFNPESWRLLRNLMLLENLNEHLGGHVTSYCNFISQLACTGADVSLLRERGIIVHSEASDETAAQKLGKLLDQIIYDRNNDYLKSDWDALDKHCRSPGSLMGAKVFGYKDWKNPLVWMGALAAVALLVCAILQTVYTIKTYKDQVKHHGLN